MVVNCFVFLYIGLYYFVSKVGFYIVNMVREECREKEFFLRVFLRVMDFFVKYLFL